MGRRWVWLAAMGGLGCTQAPPLPSDPPGRTAAASASAGRSEVAPEAEAPRVDASVVLPARPPAGVASGAAPLALTPGMVERFRGMIERSGGRPEVFAKVGDSITISGAFLRCLEGNDLRWGAHERLAEARDFFMKTRVDGRHTSFGRDTLAARVGWRTFRVLKGVPQPLAQELDALRPAWALVLLGT
ncbi:MAG: hypothetical protein MUF64_30870, partial [Polyangiaceae bacterium]|nr:hypothetical protein [Polyangiaceae bacterium]